MFPQLEASIFLWKPWKICSGRRACTQITCILGSGMPAQGFSIAFFTPHLPTQGCCCCTQEHHLIILLPCESMEPEEQDLMNPGTFISFRFVFEFILAEKNRK